MKATVLGFLLMLLAGVVVGSVVYVEAARLLSHAFAGLGA